VIEGDRLALVIHRQGNDNAAHRLVLSYIDDSFGELGQVSFVYGADRSDRVGVGIRTQASSGHHGDHHLAVTLKSADGAQVTRPDSVMATLLDRTSWWEKLLEFLSSPAGIAAIVLAGTAAALGVVKFIMPRATCSIASARATFGPIPFRSCWPAMHVDTAIGGISFAIPHPLPTGE
jgi:hypothetical protein